jgi:hypothetical protein
MDKDQILTAFNDHFKEFIEDVKRVFPRNNDIVALYKGLPGLLMLNPRLIIKSFKTNFVDVYRSQIDAGDINFFIDLDYKNDLTNLGINPTKGSMILEKINCLKEPIRQMNPEEQESVMKYMKNLMGLTDLYNQ